MRQLVRRYRDVVYVGTDGPADIDEALATFARREIDLVAVSGGDGTLQHLLTAMLGAGVPHLPLVAPLCGGRTNMSALDLGCDRTSIRTRGTRAATCPAPSSR
jgi:diacylglycerol kinase family enzyme